MAEDNAVEGCVREAYAALLAAHQAESSTDPTVASAYRIIAADEARHALLSAAIHDHAVTRLPRHARERLDDTRREAIAALSTSLEQEHPIAMQRTLGLPDATRAIEMAGVLV